MSSLCLFAIFKNESHIIREWVEHYVNEGVDHFFLIDNGSTDDYTSQVEPYKDKITIFVDATKHSQSPLYNKYVLPEIQKYTWAIGCDLDEFIWSTKQATIKETLNELDEQVGVVKIPWEQYGSAGHVRQPKNAINSFLYRDDYTIPKMIESKYIIRPDCIKSLGVHICELSNTCKVVDAQFENFPNGNEFFTMPISESNIQKSKLRLAHYQVQSYDWFMTVKTTRGDAAFEKNNRNETYFRERDTNYVFDDGLYNKKMSSYDSSRCGGWVFFLSFLFLLFFFVLVRRRV